MKGVDWCDIAGGEFRNFTNMAQAPPLIAVNAQTMHTCTVVAEALPPFGRN